MSEMCWNVLVGRGFFEWWTEENFWRARMGERMPAERYKNSHFAACSVFANLDSGRSRLELEYSCSWNNYIDFAGHAAFKDEFFETTGGSGPLIHHFSTERARERDAPRDSSSIVPRETRRSGCQVAHRSALPLIVSGTSDKATPDDEIVDRSPLDRFIGRAMSLAIWGRPRVVLRSFVAKRSRYPRRGAPLSEQSDH